jgi:hypothetical protein
MSLLTAFVLAAFLTPAIAGELKAGDPVPAFAANDQFGKEYKFEPGPRFLLLGFDMGASKQANLSLAALGAGWLEKRQAVYVLDIHTMPAVARFFALPKMRKYPQRIVLMSDEQALAVFPRTPGKITVMVLAPDGKVREVRYWKPTEPLDGILK